MAPFLIWLEQSDVAMAVVGIGVFALILVGVR